MIRISLEDGFPARAGQPGVHFWPRCLFGLPMTKKHAALYSNFTNRSELPKKPAKEAWMVVR